jgi:hypothetical protein
MAELVHSEVDAAADSGVRNSQPEGIGRVAIFDDLVCWNNLGRNVVFADTKLRSRAVFGSTLYPHDDEPSQYDLDVHSILDVREFGVVVVLNHFGIVRAFRRADLLRHTDGRLLTESSSWQFVPDVERTISAAGRLIASAPRSDGALGLLVSDCLDTLPDRTTIPTRRCATSLGEVTALGLVSPPGDPLVAVGGDGKLALVPLIGGEVGTPKWEVNLGFRVSMIAWHRGAVWAAGPDRGADVDDYDWERLGGGGFTVLEPADGKTVTSGHLPGDVAWGTGGVAAAPFGSFLVVASRSGCLHVIDPHTGISRYSTAPLGSSSLGIAHLAVGFGRVLCGFNRGGYRLHSFAEPTAVAGPP